MSEQRRRPGEWPIRHPVDLDRGDIGELRNRAAAERARFEMVISSIRASLEEQPSERAVRQAARRWNDAVTSVADEVAKQFRRRAG